MILLVARWRCKKRIFWWPALGIACVVFFENSRAFFSRCRHGKEMEGNKVCWCGQWSHSVVGAIHFCFLPALSSNIQAVQAAQEELSTCRALFEDSQVTSVCCTHSTFREELFLMLHTLVTHEGWNLHYGIMGYAMARYFSSHFESLNLEDLHAGGDGTSLQAEPPEG